MPDPGRTSSLPWLEPVHRMPEPAADPRKRKLILKYVLDRVGAATAIVLALPLFLVAALVVKLSSSGSRARA